MSDQPGSRSEIAAVLANETVRYSQVWEDHLLLERGLAIGPEDDVLSITSAGDNALAMLLAGAHSVTAIDLNPAQTHFFQLKLAGIRTLELPEFCCLIGLRAGDREALFQRLETALPADTLEFWRARAELIEAGLFNSGRLESYFGDFRSQIPDLIRAPLETLLCLDDLDEQRKVFDKVFGHEFEAAFRHHFGRDMMAKQGRDPAQFKYVNEGDVGGYFYERFRYACTSLPLAENFYVASFLCGGCDDLRSGPVYLRPANYQRLRGLLDRVTVVTDELERYVRTGPRGAFSKLNLSDIFEYMSAEAAEQLLAALASWMRPGGRIAFWNLLVPRSSGAAQRALLTPLSDLATSLWQQDRSWFYRAFHIEEVAS